MITPYRIITGYDLIYDSQILAIDSDSGSCDEVIDAKGCYVSPGFIDRHTHGGWGYDFSCADADQIVEGTRECAKTGVTAVVPTIEFAVHPTKQDWAVVEAIECAADKNSKGSEILGIHIEGAFVSSVENHQKINVQEMIPILDRMKKGLVWTVDPQAEGMADFVTELGRV
ncbi:amidohydrolase family protein [Enterocloster citroniae]|uniref:Amidohydrolase family protein n=1 Tax=Enterocloster citroniae TaxID=358743 RepID=A0AA41K7M7_9FIRM|nr:amidohydrolase family protein [Enterocloster citroniae]RGC04204.1 hypothetical protein DWZ14_29345 [Enterocloster citroniae]